MAMANMNLIGVFVTKLWPVQALACGGGGDGGDGGDGGGGGATKTIISPKFSNFGDIIINNPTQNDLFTEVDNFIEVYNNLVIELIHCFGTSFFGRFDHLASSVIKTLYSFNNL